MTARRLLAIAVVAASLSAGAGCEALDPPTAPTPSAPPATAGRHVVTLVADGVTLGGVLYRPTAVDARPAVIVLHGWLAAGTNGAATVEARARRYADEGYVALALSMRGWPLSGGADDCALRQPDDVIAAATWLQALPGVAGDRVGLVGFSQGGQVALLAAARDARIKAVVAYYPVTDVARWKSTTSNVDIPGYITAVCEPGGVESRSPLARATSIAAPVLLVHGDQDTRVPTEQSRLMLSALQSAGRRAELLIVPGAQHGFTAAEDALARPAVDQFLQRELR